LEEGKEKKGRFRRPVVVEKRGEERRKKSSRLQSDTATKGKKGGVK